MVKEQMETLADITGYSVAKLEAMDEDALWDLWEDTTTNIDYMEYVAYQCGAEDW